jgi:hypothetical protein
MSHYSKENMKRIALILLVLVTGCSTSTVDVDQKLNELGITRTESKNFLRAVAALDAACKQSDSTSIQACQFYRQQHKYIPDQERFTKTALFAPDSLTDSERPVFDNITLVGAAYREYLQAKQADADRERLLNAMALGAAFGTLFSPPASSPQPNCTVINAHTSSPLVQCQ